MQTDSFRSMAFGSIEAAPFMTARDAASAKTVAEFRKATVYVHGAVGSLLGYQWFQATRVTLQELRYSDFDRAILVKAVPRGKRGERSFVEKDSASTVVVEGWHRLDFPTPYGEEGRARYSAGDDRWDKDFAEWLDAHVRDSRLKILADLRGHDPQPGKLKATPSVNNSAPALPVSEPAGSVYNPGLKLHDPLVSFVEGGAVETTLTRYERDPEARAACLAHYGHLCVVCHFDFERVYGAIGRGFIHVHHIEPLSASEGTHVVNPIADLRPVCPNCHAMLHRRKPPYSPTELQMIRNRAALSEISSSG